MVSRTYYQLDPEPTFAHPCRLHGCTDRMHGYTLDDIHRAVRIALYAHTPLAMDRDLLHEAGWDGVVECLTETEGHPTTGELTAAALRGLTRAWQLQVHHHGYRPGGDYTDDGLGMRGPAFVVYWSDHGHAVDPMDARVVEPLAVQQVLASLPEAAERRFTQLASVPEDADDDVAAAAELAGITRQTFLKQLRHHRYAFMEALLDGDTPHRQTKSRLDRRRVQRPPCGTVGGYAAHRYRKEPTCEPCRAANRKRIGARRLPQHEVNCDQ